MRTQPPRLVHAVQRPVQLSVTSKVMQITVNGTFDWALDISAPHMMQAAFRAAGPVHRARNPGGRRCRTGRATSGWLGARRHSVTSARSARSPGARAMAVTPSHEPHIGSWRATAPVCGRWGPIVMPLSSPRYMSAVPADGTAGHQFQLRIAHTFLVVVRWRGSPVPVAHSRTPSVPAAHRRSVVPRVIPRANDRLLFTMRGGRIPIRPQRQRSPWLDRFPGVPGRGCTTGRPSTA
jgi:hypothetical protein